MTDADTPLFKTPWLTVYQTVHGFQYLERKGKDSIVLFLVKREASSIQVLVRWQRLIHTEDRHKNYPCPITGTIDKNISIVGHAIEEALEEAGYIISETETRALGNYVATTQSSEIVHMYMCDVTDRQPVTNVERISWEPLDFLLSCDLVGSQLGYHLIKQALSTHYN